MSPGNEAGPRRESEGTADNIAGGDSLSVNGRSDLAGMTPEQSRILHNWIADVNSVPAERLAYVAVVEVAEGKYRRRPYLTLAAAQNAIERAEARGVEACITLCELVPVVGAS